MAQHSHIARDLLDSVTLPSDVDEEEATDFALAALEEAVEHIDDNRKQAMELGSTDALLTEVFDPDNVRDVKIRAEPLENPKVTVWLGSVRPIWSNDAWRATIFPWGVNAYNGKVEVVMDVRPF